MDPSWYMKFNSSTSATHANMKRKASQELSKEGTEEVGEGGERGRVASSVIEIDPHGDLQLDFVIRTNDNVVRPDDNDGQLHGLLVNKHTLRLSSPVFRTMLADDSPFRKTTNRDGIQVIKLEDDDMAAMEVLMYAIHLRSNKVPMAVTITHFEELAIVCDKYDIRCLGPWAEIWSEQHLNQDCSSLPKPLPGLPRPLFIASVFQLADWFVRLTKDLILKTTSSSEGELLLEYSSHFREGVRRSILGKMQGTSMKIRC